jgi:plasmid maintenance system antidote protein VapI
LNEYLKTIDKKKKDFAQEIQIHETKLSQIINDRVEPNDKFIIRLELHSNNMFPALFWFKLIHMKQEHELGNNKEIRKKEARFVKKKLELYY